MHTVKYVRLKTENCIRVLRVSVSAASAHLHHLCRTTFHPNWRTATLIDRVFKVFLSRGFLSMPAHNRCLLNVYLRGGV